MQDQYSIIVEIKTARGFVEYCRYFLGCSAERAKNNFAMLSGDRVRPDEYALRMDLVVCHKDQEAVLDSLYCTLDDLASNSAVISKEMFKWLNIE